MLVNSALLCFLIIPDNPVPFWIVLVIIMRDFIINGFRLVASDNNAVIAADYWGKVKTTVQMIMIIVILLDFNNVIFEVIETILIYGSVILTVLSLIDCLWKNRHVLKDTSDAAGDVADCKDESIDNNINKKIVDLLKEKNYTISFAESCTGGLLAAAVVDVPGSSSVLKQSIVTYCNDAKINLINVSSDSINKYTEVSGQVAAEMAEGVCKWSGSDIGVSVTGVAGPDKGPDGNEVGTVYVGISFKGMNKSKRFVFDGDRKKVRNQAVLQALSIIYDTIIK